MEYESFEDVAASLPILSCFRRGARACMMFGVC
jgi:hypothetical protein